MGIVGLLADGAVVTGDDDVTGALVVGGLMLMVGAVVVGVGVDGDAVIGVEAVGAAVVVDGAAVIGFGGGTTGEDSVQSSRSKAI